MGLEDSKMNKERLIGILAGVFLLQAFVSAKVALVQLALSGGELSARLLTGGIPLFTAVVAGFLGVAYLKWGGRRWLQIGALVYLVLFGIGTLVRMIGLLNSGSGTMHLIFAVDVLSDVVLVWALIFCLGTLQKAGQVPKT